MKSGQATEGKAHTRPNCDMRGQGDIVTDSKLSRGPEAVNGCCIHCARRYFCQAAMLRLAFSVDDNRT